MAAPRPAGLRLIIAYKAVKAVAQLAGTALLLALATRRHEAGVHAFLQWVAAELPAGWSVRAAGLLAAAGRPHTLHLAALGLALDGTLTAVEGWSLWRGYGWGPWLVVVATGTPIPYELYEIARRVRPVRIAITAITVAVVVYLARRIRRERHQGTGR